MDKKTKAKFMRDMKAAIKKGRITADEWTRFADVALVLSFFARDTGWEKGIDDAIEALSDLKARGSDGRLDAINDLMRETFKKRRKG